MTLRTKFISIFIFFVKCTIFSISKINTFLSCKLQDLNVGIKNKQLSNQQNCKCLFVYIVESSRVVFFLCVTCVCVIIFCRK